MSVLFSVHIWLKDSPVSSLAPIQFRRLSNMLPSILALDGGNDGLIFYRTIVNNIDSVLKPNGKIYFEIGYNQGETLKNILKQKFTNINVHKDFAGLDRIVSAQLA